MRPALSLISSPPLPSPRSSTRSIYREGLLLLSALVLFLVFTHSGFDTSEAGYHYSIAERIVRHGELSFPEPRPGIYTVAPNGRTYASHEIGDTLVLLPVAGVNALVEKLLTPRFGEATVERLTQFLFAMHGALFIALGATFLYLMLRLVFRQSVRTAAAGILLMVFCSYYWNYSRYLFDGILCSVLLTAGALFLFLYARSPARTVLLVAAFACLGFGVITRVSMIIPVFAAALYLLIQQHRAPLRLAGTAAIAALTLAPFALWQLYYNHLRTGDWLLSPVQTSQYALNNGLTGNLLDGVAGLLFSPGKSVFVYVPIALLSLLCLHRFWRRYPLESMFVLVVACGWLLLHAKLQSWYGAWGYGPRHFATLVPLLALPFLVERPTLTSPLFKKLAAFLLTFGCVLAAASITTNWHYRMALAHAQDRGADRDLVWSPVNNQAVDILKAAAGNVQRLLFGGPYEKIPPYSEINLAASNSINVWLHTAYLQGVPWWLLTGCGVLLLGASLLALRSLWQLERFHAGTTQFHRRLSAAG